MNINIVDGVIVVILAVSLVFGMYRGFINGVLSMAALIGAIVFAFAFSGQLSAWLQGNETLVNTLLYYTDAGSRISDLDLSMLSVSQVSNSILTQILSSAGLPAAYETAFVDAISGSVGSISVSTLLSQTIVSVSISIMSFLICFLLCYVAALFVVHLISYVFELPVLRHLDALMGGLFGVARGVLLLFIAFALIPIILAVAPVQQISDVFAQSHLAPLFDSQIILSILGMSL